LNSECESFIYDVRLFCEERLEIKENGDCSWTGSRKVCCFDDHKCGVYYRLKCNATNSGGNNQNVQHKFSENSTLQKVITIEYLSGKVKGKVHPVYRH
jgi:hypothetical protein